MILLVQLTPSRYSATDRRLENIAIIIFIFLVANLRPSFAKLFNVPLLFYTSILPPPPPLSICEPLKVGAGCQNKVSAAGGIRFGWGVLY